MGEKGKGVANYFNLEDEIDLYMGTFSKSLGSIGGFISSKSEITEYIRHKASAFIFTAALPPASVAGVTEVGHSGNHYVCFFYYPGLGILW